MGTGILHSTKYYDKDGLHVTAIPTAEGYFIWGRTSSFYRVTYPSVTVGKNGLQEYIKKYNLKAEI